MAAPVAIKGQPATLAGKQLLNTSAIRWRLAEGVDPVTEVFDIPRDQEKFFAKLADDQTPVSLIIRPTTGKDVVVKNLFIIEAKPGDSPHIAKVLVGDLRWRWPYIGVMKRYNMRRRVGFQIRRVHGPAAILQQITNKIQYATYSLPAQTGDTDKAWTALDLILDVLKSGDALNIGASMLDVRTKRLEKLKQLTVENVQLREGGADALRRVLALLPGARIYVDYDGKVVLDSNINLAGERAMVAEAGAEIAQGGHAEFLSNSSTRPREIWNYFTREIEMRVDFVQQELTGSVSVFQTDDPRLDNVMPNPDPELTLTNGTVLPQGAWVKIQDAIDAWNAEPVKQGRLVKLTLAMLGQAMIPGMGIWQMLELAGLAQLETKLQGNWSQRFAMIKNHLWTTYRIPKEFYDRVLLMRAETHSSISPTDGTRGQAPAYMNHCKHFSLKTLVRGGRLKKTISRMTNVNGYPSGPNNASGNPSITAEDQVSPFTVSIVDQDMGIIKLTPKIDPLYEADLLLPGLVDNIPTFDASKSLKSVVTDAVSKRAKSKVPGINPLKIKVAVILTMIPAAPNSKSQLHKIVVKPKDVRNILPGELQAGLLEANGPVKEVFHPPTVETARIAWSDADVGLLNRCFGINATQPPTREQLLKLCINDAPQAAIPKTTDGVAPAASLLAIARSASAAIWAAQYDRIVGAKTVAMNGKLEPAGGLGEISHTLEPDGAATSHVKFPENGPALDMYSFLDPTTRAILNREVRQ